MKSLEPCSRGCGGLTHRGRCRGPPRPVLPVAQRPEHPAVDRGVGGSIPSREIKVDEGALLLEKVVARNGLLDIRLGPAEGEIIARLERNGAVKRWTVDGYTLWRATEP